MADSRSVVLHFILAVQGGVLVHCVFCSSAFDDNLWWKNLCRSIAPQMTAVGVVTLSRGTDTIASTNHCSSDNVYLFLLDLFHHSEANYG